MKLNIRQRVFRLVLSASVLTFPVLAIVLLIGIILIHYTLEEKSEALSKYLVDYIEQVVTERKTSESEKISQGNAEEIDRALNEQSLDADCLAKEMNIELKSPTIGFSAQNLIMENYEPIPSGAVYIFYTPELLERGIDPALSQEITRAGNIAKFFIPFGERYKSHYSSFMAASKNGYYICVETSSSRHRFSRTFTLTRREILRLLVS